MHPHEDVLRDVFEITVTHAEAAQRGPDVVEFAIEDGAKAPVVWSVSRRAVGGSGRGHRWHFGASPPNLSRKAPREVGAETARPGRKPVDDGSVDAERVACGRDEQLGVCPQR